MLGVETAQTQVREQLSVVDSCLEEPAEEGGREGGKERE